MEGVLESNDTLLARVQRNTMFFGKLQGCFVGFSTGVTQKHFTGVELAAKLFGFGNKFFAQIQTFCVVIQVTRVDQFAGLVAHNLGDLRVGMAKRGDCNTSGKIDVLFTIHIIEQLGVGASGNHQIVRPCISGHLEGLFVDEVR